MLVCYQLRMKYFIFFLLPLSAFSQVPGCPPETFLVEYQGPVTHGKEAFCGLLKNGETVKHGEEYSFDPKGVLLKKRTFNQGIESPSFGGVTLPGTEESRSGKSEALGAIKNLAGILAFRKGSDHRIFKVTTCHKNLFDWLLGGAFKNSIPQEYRFGVGCDVEGSFTVNFENPFPMGLKLRNLHDFTWTDMKVLVQPMTGVPIESSQKGEITLLQINGKEVLEKSSLVFEE